MSAYPIVVFLHIVGALTLFAGLGLEWAGIWNLRRVTTIGHLREWAGLLTVVRRLVALALAAILGTGIYLSAVNWGPQPWIGAGFNGLVVMVVAGAWLTSRRTRALARAIPFGDGTISPDLGRRLHDPLLLLSAWLRTGLALGILFVMSTKPGEQGARAALIVAVVTALVAALASRTLCRLRAARSSPA